MKKLSILLVLITVFTIANAQDSIYKLGPDSYPRASFPKGTVTKYTWDSKIYNNFREYFVYVPAQYNSSTPAALMVFQDGRSYANDSGDFRVPTVFDNLIAQKRMPVTIALFVNPGQNNPPNANGTRPSNRSEEYDVMSNKYANFLIEELIPELKKKYNISDDRKMHAIAGLSSGAICAFTAAWERNDYFQKVMSHFGSYTDIRGGYAYPAIIRKSAKKDIKIFMQDGSNDLNNQFGDWWLANLQMESSFRYKGYEYQFIKGIGTHSGKHAGSILPESLTWLWSDVNK